MNLKTSKNPKSVVENIHTQKPRPGVAEAFLVLQGGRRAGWIVSEGGRFRKGFAPFKTSEIYEFVIHDEDAMGHARRIT